MINQAYQQKIKELATKLLDRQRELTRCWIGIVGVPGSGKSTLAEALSNELRAVRESAVVIPMDGYHFSRRILEERGLTMHKGKPETFDCDHLLMDLEQLKKQPNDLHRFPRYDRELHEPVADALRVNRADRFILIEGNYLLLNDHEPWTRLKSFFDESWYLKCDWHICRERLLRRHLNGGKSQKQAEAHIERVDYPNAQRIIEQMDDPNQVVNLPLD